MKRLTFVAASIAAGAVATTGLIPAVANIGEGAMPVPGLSTAWEEKIEQTLAYKCLLPDHLSWNQMARYEKYQDQFAYLLTESVQSSKEMIPVTLIEGQEFLVPTFPNWVPSDNNFIRLIELSSLMHRNTPWLLKDLKTKPRITPENMIVSQSDWDNVIWMLNYYDTKVHVVPDGIMQPHRIYELHRPEFLGVLVLRSDFDGFKKVPFETGMAIINPSGILAIDLK